MFPIRDQRGRIIGFGGRVLGDDKPKYLNSPETPTFHKSRELYGLYEARKHNNSLNRLLIVEGYMDVVGLAQYDIHFAVATLGTATTAQHLERLFKIVPEIIFCFDGDNAGREAASRALKTTLPVIEDGKEARFLFLPDGEDPDSLVRQEGKEEFTQRLDKALPLSEFFFRHYSEDADLDSMDGRARFSSNVLPAINAMKPSLLQQMMLDRICDLTHLSLEQIQTTINFREAVTPQPRPSEPAALTDNSTEQFYPEPIPADEYSYDSSYPEQYPDEADTGYGKSTTQPQPKRTSYKEDKQQVTHSFTDKLIALLLHYPQLAAECNLPNNLNTSQSAGIQLLLRLVKYYQETPNATLGQLAVDWREESNLSDMIIQLYDISSNLEIHTEDEARRYMLEAERGLQLSALEISISALQQKHNLDKEEKIQLIEFIQQLNKLKTIHKD